MTTPHDHDMQARYNDEMKKRGFALFNERVAALDSRETPYERVLRLVEVYADGGLAITYDEWGKLARHLAGNLWPDADNQPVFLTDLERRKLELVRLIATTDIEDTARHALLAETWHAAAKVLLEEQA